MHKLGIPFKDIITDVTEKLDAVNMDSYYPVTCKLNYTILCFKTNLIERERTKLVFHGNLFRNHKNILFKI